MKVHRVSALTKVLLYREGEEIVAHSLDFDLLGYGAEEGEAMQALSDEIEGVISFGLAKRELGMIDRPAPPEFFDRWENARRKALLALPGGEKAEEWEFRARFVEVISPCRRKHKEFRRAQLATA